MKRNVVICGLVLLFTAQVAASGSGLLFWSALLGSFCLAFVGGALIVDDLRVRCRRWLDEPSIPRSERLQRAIQLQAANRSADEWAEYIVE